MLTCIAFAKTAEHTRIELHAFRVGVWLAQIGRGLRKGMVAKQRGCLSDHLPLKVFFPRGRWVPARARPFKRIPARLDHAAQVTRLAAGAEQILETIVVRLELRVADTPVLNSQVRIKEIRAVALAND